MKKRMLAAAVLTAFAIPSVPLTGPDVPVERLPETLLQTRIRLNLQSRFRRTEHTTL